MCGSSWSILDSRKHSKKREILIFPDLGSLGTRIFDSLPTTQISASSHPRRSPTAAALENDGARPLLGAERATAAWIHPNYRCTDHITRFQAF